MDPSTNDVFIVEGLFGQTMITQYDENGAILEQFGPPDPGKGFLGLEQAAGVAIDPVTHDL